MDICIMDDIICKRNVKKRNVIDDLKSLSQGKFLFYLYQ